MTPSVTITTDELLEKLEFPPFRAIDRQFASFLISRCKADEATALAGAAASAVLALGHSCFDIDVHCQRPWGDDEGKTFQLPEADQWITALKESPAVGAPGERTPLILDDRRLYLYKYYQFEKKVADRLRSMSQIADVTISEPVHALARILIDDANDLSAFGGQLQTAGALIPFFSKFSIITGGPGTGKTTVLSTILALLCAEAKENGQPFPTIQLAAPTGKAAQRMGDSIAESAVRVPDPEIKAHLSRLAPSTIHRLLGLYGDSPKPKRDHRSPIDADIIVIDEASMMDITMFARLIDALPATARLILLGDRYQLASVQAGCVLANLCDALKTNSFTAAFIASANLAIVNPVNRLRADEAEAVLSPVVELKYSYRFKGLLPIGVTSQAIREENADLTISHLKLAQSDVEYCRFSPEKNREELAAYILGQYQPLLQAPGPKEAIALVKKFMVLTVVNDGPIGRIGINEQIYRSLGSTPRVRPIKITENSQAHDLYNGDIGVIMCVKNSDGEEIERAWFPDTAATAMPSADPRQFLVGALPAFVDAFAITIHNSQGSEFDEVMIVLPDKDTQLLTRELLYTGVTRARKKVNIYGSEEIVRIAVGRKTDRHSGLEMRLL